MVGTLLERVGACVSDEYFEILSAILVYKLKVPAGAKDGGFLTLDIVMVTLTFAFIGVVGSVISIS